MISSKELLNKVNLITISRIILSIIGVMFLFSGNIRLLVVAYAIMGFSEVSDVIDGYVARRDKLVTDFGKILDPLSDSISRFFFFFAFAYHGLFPIWYMIFFFFRDIVVAYVRIYASFSGVVMSARISGKVKAACQFGGQYILMLALMINVYQDTLIKPDYDFFIYTTIIGLLIYFLLLIYFKIKGFLLAIVAPLSFLLAALLLVVPYIPFKINYIITFGVAFLTLSVTLYSLVDYICSLDKRVRKLSKIISTLIFIIFMFLISPYFLDSISNKIETGAVKLNYEKMAKEEAVQFNHFSLGNEYYLTVEGGYIILNNSGKNVQKIKLDTESSVRKVTVIDNKIFVLDSHKNKILVYRFLNNEISYFSSYKPRRLCGIRAMTSINYNNNKYLVLQDKLVSRKLFFIDISKLESNSKILQNVSFSIDTEFYIKSLQENNGKLYALAGKIGNDLIYEIDINKLITSGDLSKSIFNIWESSIQNVESLIISDNKIILTTEQGDSFLCGKI